MLKLATFHLADNTIYFDSEDGSRYVSTDPALLEIIDELSKQLSQCKESGKLQMSAACRAVLSENWTVSPKEIAYVPLGSFEGISYPLPRVSAELRIELGEALNNRRSRRNFGVLPLGKLSDLLHYSARVQGISVTAQGFPSTTRPSPSAGARHPVEIVVVTGATMMMEGSDDFPKTWRYDAVGHSAISMPEREALQYSAVVEAAGLCLEREPSAVLVLAAVPWRTLSRYPAGSGFLLLDTGALLSTLHLVACGLDVVACPVAIAALGLNEQDVGLEARIPVVGLAIG